MNLISSITKKSPLTFQLSDENEYFEALQRLKIAAIVGTIVKGVKETLKAIEAKKCLEVFLSKECEDDSYKKCIKDYCEMYSIPIIEVENKYLIRDTVMLGLPSDILISKALSIGKEPKVMPNCHVAAILEESKSTNINTKLNEQRD